MNYLMMIEQFVRDLAAAFSKSISKETARFYREKLFALDLTSQQLGKALDRVTEECEKFPTWKELRPFLMTQIRGTQAELVPVFRTWRDRDGRCYAQRISDKFQNAIPSPETWEQWKREACSLDERRRAFREGFLAASGDAHKLAFYHRAVESKPEAPRRPAVTEDEEVPF